MAENINVDSSQVLIDEEVGSGGSFNLNGHNNNMKLSGINCDEIVVTGHNNIITGVHADEEISKLVVLGHNNVIRNLTIRVIEVQGHNNNFKNLQLLKMPVDSGYQNKFSNVDLLEDDSEEYDESVTYDTAGAQNFDSSSESSESSDDGYHNIHSHTQNFTINTNFGSNCNVEEFMFKIQSQIDNIHFGDSEESEVSDETDEEQEEEKYYQQEEPDEEAHISPNQRIEIINSINSFAYKPKKKTDEENCAVCLCALERKQYVKTLP